MISKYSLPIGQAVVSSFRKKQKDWPQHVPHHSPVKDAKVGESNGQFVVSLRLLVEHETVTGTIHRLQCKLLLLNFESENIDV